MEKHGTRSSVNRSVMQMVVSAMMLALAVLLDFVVSYIPGLNWPNGGTITLAMLPLFLVGFLAGPFWGFAVSLMFGVIDMLLGTAWGFNWASILLDYILGFGVCGVCGFFTRSFYQKKMSGPYVGMILAGILRFACSFLSGCVVMWDVSDTGTFDPHFDVATVTYSAVYNLGYILPSIILSIIVFSLVAKPLFLLSDSRVLRNIRPSSTLKDEGKKTGFLGGFGFDSLLPFLSFALVLCGGLAFVPTITYEAVGDTFIVDFLALGYVGIAFSAVFLIYSVIRLILSRKPTDKENLTQGIVGNPKNARLLYLIAILLCVIALVVSILAVVFHAPLE